MLPKVHNVNPEKPLLPFTVEVYLRGKITMSKKLEKDTIERLVSAAKEEGVTGLELEFLRDKLETISEEAFIAEITDGDDSCVTDENLIVSLEKDLAESLEKELIESWEKELTLTTTCADATGMEKCLTEGTEQEQELLFKHMESCKFCRKKYHIIRFKLLSEMTGKTLQ